MTGRYNFRNYSRWAFLDPNEVTFGNVLKEAGYRTCLAGKWQLGEDVKAPGKLGFDTYCVWQLFVENMGSRYSDPTIHIDGRSFAPQIKGQRGHPGEWIFSHYEPRFPWKDYGKTRWVRNHRWKLYDNGSFFDVQNDPLEANPLKPADLNQEALAAKRRLLKVLAVMKEE